MINATICTIGDEILIGQIVDTNSAMIAKELNHIGVKVCSMTSCSDDKSDIISTLSNALSRSEIVIVTGGLGPTKDDITKDALCCISGSKRMKQCKEQFDINQRLLRTRGISMSDINIMQSAVPENAEVITNKVGTAPILQFSFNKSKFGRKNLMFCMPGVPFETQNALPRVMESIKEHFKLSNIVHKTISTFGIAESTLSKMIEEWELSLDKRIHLAYLPNPILGVRLRLSIYDIAPKEGEKLLSKEIRKLKRILGDAIYSLNDSSPVEVIGKLLLKQGATISSAESCTGGLIAHLFTQIPGASRYYMGTVVSYDNSVKENLLNVQNKTLQEHGAVSKECVEQMAQGVRGKMHTTYSIATSGIAGPGGGSKDKPVGTLWIAVCGPNGIKSVQYRSNSTRETNIKRFASAALDTFRRALINDEI